MSTLPLELQAGISAIDNGSNEGANVGDGAFVHSAVDNVRNLSGLPMWRCHTASQLLIIDDLNLSKMSVDKISQFLLQQPEFLNYLIRLVATTNGSK
eukprot:13660803-Ditylum_brightwellii.AAC.1